MKKEMQMLKTDRTERRRFLKCALAAGVAPYFVPSHVLGAGGATPPSNKITLGVIGTGAQGRADMGNFLRLDDVRVTAFQIERAYRAVICSFVLHANYCTVPSQSWQGIRSTTLLVRNFHSVYPSIQVRWQ